MSTGLNFLFYALGFFILACTAFVAIEVWVIWNEI